MPIITISEEEVKDNAWSFVNLVKLVQNARIGEGEVVELLKIANGYLPRVTLEYDRIKDELNYWKTGKPESVTGFKIGHRASSFHCVFCSVVDQTW